MDDNARLQRPRVVTDYLENETIERMDWQSLSPDLNPKEHAWDKLQQAISARPELPKNRKELSAALVEEWGRLPQSFSEDLSAICRGVAVRLFKHRVAIQHIEHIRPLCK
jgi:transposase